MKNFKVFCTRKIHQEALNLLGETFNFDYHDSLDKLPHQILEQKIKDCDAIVSMLEDNLDSSTLSKAQNLKYISNYAVGINNIDQDYCRGNNIKIGNTPGILTHATADLALALLLSLNRKILPSYQSITRNEWKGWSPSGFLGQDLTHKTLGIIGLGRIGSAFAQKVQSLYACKVIYHNRSISPDEQKLNAKKVSIEQLCRQSDIISIHCPLTDETKNLINHHTLGLMKKNCLFINTARGEVHDETDLYQALKDRKIAGAGLDVTNPEPMKKDSPLLTLDNIVITPHIGSALDETRKQMALMCVQNITQFFNPSSH